MKTKFTLALFALISVSLAGCGSNNAKNASASNDGNAEAATAAKPDGDNSRTINGHKFVDLGLPSGLLWAETNIGAETATDNGDYFAWGETAPKESYTWESGKYFTSEQNMTKYNKADGKTVLDEEDDAAHINWGAPCRMPTEEECMELKDGENCTWTLETRKTKSGSEIKGYLVKSQKNGSSIFLPFSSSYSGENLLNHNEEGTYYSSTLFVDYENCALGFVLKSDDAWWSSITRNFGCTIRPVAKP